MPIPTIDASGKLLTLKIRGTLKKADYDQMIQIGRQAIAREVKVRALISLEDFEGWERQGERGDVSFMMEEGWNLEKMAIIGDEKWKDDAVTFTAKGFRALATN